MREAKKLTRSRLMAASRVLAELYDLKQVREIEVPGREEHLRLVRELVLRSWTSGYLAAETEMHKGALTYADDPPSNGWSGPPPNSAIEWARNRSVLLGKWNRDLDSEVTAVLVRGLETGASHQKVMEALAEVFPKFSSIRLENIARTESTSALNQGRLSRFRESDSGIVAVRFFSVLDARTTDICRSRHGLIMMLDDPRLPENTPPLHFFCRSVLLGVSELALEDLQDENPRAMQRYFGYLPEDGPKSLPEALKRWDDASVPARGFGGVEKQPRAKGSPRKKTSGPPSGSSSNDGKVPSPPAERTGPMPAGSPIGPDEFGGTGYGDKPRRRDLATTVADISGVKLKIVNHWEHTGELENVISALGRVKSKHIQGLKAVEFVNHRIEGKNGRAYATYNPGLTRVLVTRDEPRDYRSSANRRNQILASHTLLHEAMHHVWFQDKDGDLRRAWALALRADGVKIPGSLREEEFCEEFIRFLRRRERYAKIRPSLAKFYEQFIS